MEKLLRLHQNNIHKCQNTLKLMKLINYIHSFIPLNVLFDISVYSKLRLINNEFFSKMHVYFAVYTYVHT